MRVAGLVETEVSWGTQHPRGRKRRRRGLPASSDSEAIAQDLEDGDGEDAPGGELRREEKATGSQARSGSSTGSTLQNTLACYGAPAVLDVSQARAPG